MIRLPRVTTGIQSLDGAWSKWVDAIERGLAIRGIAPLIVEMTASGPIVKMDQALKFHVKLTGGGTLGAYTATQVMASATGAWVVFPSGWTGTAYEYNANATLPVTGAHVVEVTYYGKTNDYRFQSGTC